MSTRKNMIARASDGTEVVLRTAGGYDTAGLIRRPDGTWYIAAQGNSAESVRKRTRAAVNRYHGGSAPIEVRPLHEETAPMVRDYFGTHDVRITSCFHGGQWRLVLTSSGQPGSYRGDRTMLRRLALAGVEAVAVTGRRPGEDHQRTADFQMDEIARSCGFRLPQRAAS